MRGLGSLKPEYVSERNHHALQSSRRPRHGDPSWPHLVHEPRLALTGDAADPRRTRRQGTHPPAGQHGGGRQQPLRHLRRGGSDQGRHLPQLQRWEILPLPQAHREQEQRQVPHPRLPVQADPHVLPRARPGDCEHQPAHRPGRVHRHRRRKEGLAAQLAPTTAPTPYGWGPFACPGSDLSDDSPGVAAADEAGQTFGRRAGDGLASRGDLGSRLVVVRRPLDLAEDADR